jgi:predicted metalloprotease with PDZ domain
VTANIENVNQPRLDLSLPVWTPGWYVIENYATNILRFGVTDEKGASLSHVLIRRHAWSVDTEAHHRIKVEFDYRATVRGVNQAKITKDFASFTGTELFLMAEGHRSSPSTVCFIVPSGWKVASALKETADRLTFRASDYDTLVDAPTKLGHFDVNRFEVEGKPHYLVTTPAGSFPSDRARQKAGSLTRIASAAGAIFGGLPYEKYLYFYFFIQPEGEAGGGGLEHLNSYVIVGVLPSEAVMDLASAYEFFHLWNVKRIRPIEMWPYDYSRENENPLLWVSEGFTEYYANVIAYRAGVHNAKWFFQSVRNGIEWLENSEARRYISPAEASVSAWLVYGTSEQWFITQGQNLAAVLDLSIHHDTNGKASLDDVMRTLYRDFYQQGKGFSSEDMIGVIDHLTNRDHHDFYHRYVREVEVPPCDVIFSYAGYQVARRNQKRPVIGFHWKPAGEGTLRILDIEPGSPAAAAGLAVGDLILKAGNRPAIRFGWDQNENAGRTVRLTVKRADEERELSMTFGARDWVSYKLVEVAQPSADQLKIRKEWLKVGN